MLKINLLPPYIYERRNRNRAIFVSSFFVVLVFAGMIAWQMQLKSQETNKSKELAQVTTEANYVRDLQQKLATEQAKLPVLQSREKFIEDVMAYNVSVPALYEDVAKYTYSRIVYRSMQVSGSNLTIQAHAKSVGDCGRYLLNMYRASHLFQNVAVSGVPGWSGGQASGGGAGASLPGIGGGAGIPGIGAGAGVPAIGAAAGNAGSTDGGFDFTVTCTLVHAINAPTPPSGGGQAAAAAPGLGAMGGGAGGPMGGMAPGGGGAGGGVPGIGAGMPGRR